ncbi:hypothetical protein [Halomicrococcus sp. NG-SE-24]|uniref:hypothetical protein n=1 Tax=Halomicrococcus sp. NG-SE-24 TaxID=3436928 RepID=UPI003D969960
MTDPNVLDKTVDDYKRHETDLLAQDRDVAQVSTADVDKTTARHLVSDLVDDGIVTPVADQRALVHEPSGEAFDLIQQIAVFHRGWTAGRSLRPGRRAVLDD